MKTLKQVVGIDVSKDSFHACLGTINEQQNVQLLQQSAFSNSEKGFKLFLAWVQKHSLAETSLFYVMEATGVYYENLAYFLSESTSNICVLLPNKSKHFAKSLDIKTKTDKVDAGILCRIGLERALPAWKIPSPELKRLKSLCREYRSLKADGSKIKAKLHALNHSYKPDKDAIRRLNQQLKWNHKLVTEVETAIKELIKTDPCLNQRFENIEQVKGLSRITIATIIAETNGFAAIENVKQLASYAGMDVMMNQSGLYSGRTRISKKGNRHIRTALYLPAMSAIRSNKRLQQFYNNIRERQKNGKVGIVAVARKMLILIYTLWKKEVQYDPLMNVI
jgi:transposase